MPRHPLKRATGTHPPPGVSHDNPIAQLPGRFPPRLLPCRLRRAVHGFIDFSHVLNVKSIGSNSTFPATATAITTLDVEDQTTATLHLSWDDRMKIRLDDGPVKDLGDHQPYKYKAVQVKLRKGKNTLRLSMNNPARGLTWGAFTFSCRVKLPDGTIVIPQSR